MKISKTEDSAMDRPRKRAFVSTFLSALKPSTRSAYAKDLEYFRRFLGCPDIEAAAKELLSGGGGEANQLVRGYLADMRDRGLAARTINRRLSSLRCMVTVANEAGLVSWSLKVRGLKTRLARDTSGPGIEVVRSMVTLARSRRSPALAARDVAILRIMFDIGLRLGEVVGLDLSDWSRERGERGDYGALMVTGKGREESERMDLPRETAKALEAWRKHRGEVSGPLFTSHRGKRLGAMSIYRMITRLGHELGVKVHPHGIRHTAITLALDAFDGDVRSVRQFSRHSSVETVLVYDDARTSKARAIRDKLAELL